MSTLTVVLPIFSVAFLGYLLTALRVFRERDIAGLTRYVFYVALPVMLFDSMSQVTLPGAVRWSFLAAYYVPTFVVFGLGLVLGRRMFRQQVTESGLFAMGCAYSNSVLLGLPVVIAAWGDQALLPMMMLIVIHTAILFSLTTVVAEYGRGLAQDEVAVPGADTGAPTRAPGTSLRGALNLILHTSTRTLRNPIVGGLMVGLVFNVLDIPISESVRTVTGLLRGSALPAALFVAGASLRQARVTGHLPETGVILLLKLVVHPLLVWLVAVLILQLPPLWAGVAVVTAGLPTGINATVFAGRYQAAVAPVGGATLAGTVISIATVTWLLTTFSP